MSKSVEKFIQDQLGKEIDSKQLISALKTGSMKVKDIAEKFQVPMKTVMDTIQTLTRDKVMFQYDGDEVSVREAPCEGGKTALNHKMWQGDTIRIGFTSDNHLGSHFERLDVLNALYDIFESEEIPLVLNGGNWIDGEARFNKNEIHTHGFGRQIQYAVDNFPFRKGIETWFVSGDDHEGWYNQREGINSGDYFQMIRERDGKHDLKHLGYVEADVNLNGDEFEYPMWLRLMHAGGGSSYAHSYSVQKIIESFQGGEKPHILMVGHYHKMSYNYVRGVYAVQMGTTMDQSIFMRKKKLEAHVGGGIIEIRRAPDGIVNRVRPEFITFFDKKFYVGKDKYWKGL